MQNKKEKAFAAVFSTVICLIILGLSVVSDSVKVSQTSWSSKGNSQFSSYDLSENISSIKILEICRKSLKTPINIALETEPKKTNFLRIKIKTVEDSSTGAIDDKCNIGINKSSTDVKLSTSDGALDIKPEKRLENEVTNLEVISNLDFEYIIETSRYAPNSYRKIAFLFGILIFIVFFFLERPKNPDKRDVMISFKVMMIFSSSTILWGLFGPSIYDEGWTLVTGKTFQNLGWFSNVYSSASAPMPLGTPFNYLTHFLLLLPKPLLVIRLVWAILVILSYFQMARILENHFGTIKPKIQLLSTSIYFVLVISLCGGWRPEILGLIIFNYMVLCIQSKVPLSPYLIGSLIAIGLSISQSGVINFAFLIILYHLREKAPKKIIQAIFAFSIVFCWILLSHSSLRQFLNGIFAFRNVETHNTIPLIGEVRRYTQFFMSPQSLTITITFCFILLSLLNVIQRLKRSRKWEETSLLLILSIFFLSITPSKWWWHFAPISTLFVLYSIPYFYNDAKKTTRIYRSKIEYLAFTFMVLILVRSVYFTVRLSPTFPFNNSSSLPQVLYPAYLFLAVVFFYFMKKNTASIKNIKLHLKTNIIVGVISLSFVLPVLQNYFDTSQSRLSNIFERRLDDTCQSLKVFYSLELAGKEILDTINANNKVVSSEAIQLHELDSLIPEGKNNQSNLILPIKVPRGSFIQIADENGNYLIVDSPRSNFIVKREMPSFDEILHTYSVSSQIPSTAYYIKPTNRVQILRLREIDPASKLLKIRLLTAGNYSVGDLKHSNLVTLDKEIGSSALGVIPPLVSNFGCISSNLFETKRPDNRMFIIQDNSMWFSDEQYGSSEISGHSTQQIEVPIWDVDNVHLFNLAVFGF
jgi:hypothetical protein